MIDLRKYKGIRSKYKDKKIEYLKRKKAKNISFESMTSCVYFLYSDDNLVYIGQTHDLFMRFEEGHKMKGKFDEFSFIEFKGGYNLDNPIGWDKRAEQREILEADLIKKYRPSDNIEHNPDNE